MTDWQVGDRYRAPKRFNGSTGEILAIHGESYWVLPDDGELPFTPSRAFIDSWVKDEPFYKERETYRYNNASDDRRYKVVDVYLYGNKKYASVEVARDGHPSYMTMLDELTFDLMKKI